MVNFLPTTKLAQSILKRKFPSRRAFEKYKPRGLFSEFYGMLGLSLRVGGWGFPSATMSMTPSYLNRK